MWWGIAVALVLLPSVTYRVVCGTPNHAKCCVLHSRLAVALGPAVSLLQASPSFLTIAWCAHPIIAPTSAILVSLYCTHARHAPNAPTSLRSSPTSKGVERA